MHRRTPVVSRSERVASLAAATGVTLGTALVVLAALEPVFVSMSRSTPGLDAERVSEHVMYVRPPAPVPVVAPTRQAARTSARIEPRGPTATIAGEPRPALRRDSVSSAAEAAVPSKSTRETTSGSRVAAGAPVSGAVVGFRRSSEPFRADSAAKAVSERLSAGLTSGLLKPPGPTQEERDAKLRDQSFEIVDARGKGEPVRTNTPAGSIPIPLPFGGPSRKQRERDRAIGAELAVMRAVRQARVDSVVAARQRRRADSLARIADSMRAGVRPQP